MNNDKWLESQTLHVIAVYNNPFRIKNRLSTFRTFAQHMRQTANVELHIVEIAFGERPFEVSKASDHNDTQLRTNDVLWYKENAINIGIARLPKNWKYAAYVDGDFHFTRADWALETIHQLQHNGWVQPFSGYGFMSDDHRPVWCRPGFAYSYHKYFKGCLDTHKQLMPVIGEYGSDPQQKFTSPGAVGGAWAFTKESLFAAGGFLDICILGSADWFMAFGLIGRDTDDRDEIRVGNSGYVRAIKNWQARAFASTRGNIGYTDSFIVHEWHGDIRNRGYEDRWRILKENDFDPTKDLVRDEQGLLHWAGNKPKLEDAVSKYFLGRCEDSSVLTYKALY